MTIKKKKRKKRRGAYSSRLGNGTVGLLGAGLMFGGYYSLDIHVVSRCTNTFSRQAAGWRRCGERILARRAQRFGFDGGGKPKNCEAETAKKPRPRN